MDQRLPYEEIISGKLQRLPLPDMTDAIWARIERQLDTDLPTDDGGGSATPPSGPSTGTIGWGLSVFMIALVAVLLLSKKDQPTTQPTTVTTAPKVRTPQNSNTTEVKENVRSTKKDDPPPQRVIVPPTASGDSTVSSAITSIVPDVIDSALAKPPTLVVAPPALDTGKKKRGVSGIGPGDYRIVPKKDNR